jgi:hypothetical protein
MVDAVIRLVEQREVNEPGHPALRHDAARRAVHRRAGEADVLHILAKALHVRGQPRRDEMQPEEIFPRIEDRDRRQDRSPDDRRDRELRPNAPTQFLVPNGRTAAEEGPQKRNGVNSSPIVSSSTAARTRAPRGICGWTKGQSSSSRSEAR